MIAEIARNAGALTIAAAEVSMLRAANWNRACLKKSPTSCH